MNFFERQRQVRRLSWRLVLLFGVAVVGIVLVVDLAVLLAFGGLEAPLEEALALVLVASVVTTTVIALSSLFRMLSLRGGGGGKVARSLGGVAVPEDTTDPQLRRLRNVVEEVAIASGVPVPELYVLEGEPGINAFAAGWSPSDAAVAVTRGALERLNRDELQGVIAHEFSHVINGDMRLNIRLMGLLFGILVLAIGGRMLLYTGRGRGSRNNPLPLVGIALLIAGYVGVFVGRLIKAAVSRQREYLADASAVQFTRQTTGLAGALKKIGGLPSGSTLNSAKTEEVSHMLFGSGKGFSGMFATHPPLAKRIQALDPTFNPAELGRLARGWADSPPSGLHEDRMMGLADAGSRAPLPAADTAVAVAPQAVAGAVGESAQHHAETLLAQIPEDLRERARRSDTALALVGGLLLSAAAPVRANQHAVLVARYGQDVADAAGREADVVAGLHPSLRLPLAELSFPALRHLPRPEQDRLTTTVQELIRADSQISVSEYCLSRLLYRELYEISHRQPPWGRQRHSAAAQHAAAANLLSTLAYAGHDDPGAARTAFDAGMGVMQPSRRFPYQPPADGVAALEAGWPALDSLGPAGKQRLVEAMVTVISHDGELILAEMELLRTICAILHCPLPPLAHGVWGDDGAGGRATPSGHPPAG